jgi:dCTP diphosphatase
MTFIPCCLESIRSEIQQFADERAWEQFHTPRNLLLAVLSELGEAAEIVRWQGDSDPSVPADKRQAWDEEIADVFTLLIRLADRSGVDLSAAFAAKLAKARAKYPIPEFKGSNRKYNDPKPPASVHT